MTLTAAGQAASDAQREADLSAGAPHGAATIPELAPVIARHDDVDEVVEALITRTLGHGAVRWIGLEAELARAEAAC